MLRRGKAHRSIGVFLDVDRVHAVQVLWRGMEPEVEISRELEVVGEPKSNGPLVDSELLRKLFEGFHSRASVQVALPDSLFRFVLLDLESKPPATVLDQLLSRHAGTSPDSAGQLRFGVHWFDTLQGESFKLFAVGAEGGAVGALEAAFEDAGRFPEVMDAAINYRLNYLDLLARPSGAFLYVDRLAWTLTVWDERCRLKLVRSQTRVNSTESADALEISVRARNLIIGLVETARFEIKELHFLTRETELPMFEAALNDGLQEIRWMPADRSNQGPDLSDNICRTALAASMPR